MKNFILLLITSFCLAAFVSVEPDVHTVEKFNDIDVSGSYDVTLVESGKHEVEVEMVTGNIETVNIYVENGTLFLKYKKKGFKWNNKDKARVTIHYSKIKGLEMSGGSKVKTDGPIASESFMLDVSSGSSATLEIEANMLEVDLSSGSRAKVTGTADTQKVDVSSGAAYQAKRLETKTSNVDVSSGAVANVWVTEEITAEASSGGSIQYKGEPEKKNIESSKYSGGNIKEIKSKKAQ